MPRANNHLDSKKEVEKNKREKEAVVQNFINAKELFSSRAQEAS